MRVFEVGHAFWGEGERVLETDQLAILLGGRLGTPWERSRELDFYDLKGWVEGLAEVLGVELLARPAERMGFEPGTSADLALVSSPEKTVGFLGRWAEEEAYPLYVAEIDLEALRRELEVVRVVVPSRFPGISVDLTLTHGLELHWADLAAAVAAEKDELRLGFTLRDRYRGKGVPEGAVNTTIGFTYGAADRSLTQEEVNGVMPPCPRRSSVGSATPRQPVGRRFFMAKTKDWLKTLEDKVDDAILELESCGRRTPHSKRDWRRWNPATRTARTGRRSGPR